MAAVLGSWEFLVVTSLAAAGLLLTMTVRALRRAARNLDTILTTELAPEYEATDCPTPRSGRTEPAHRARR
jgi:hypothetical protein